VPATTTSISEFEKLISVMATMRFRRPESMSRSTAPLQFSTPASASRVGFSPLRPLTAWCKRAAVTLGSKVADTFQARMRREKLSMMARK
jgi:hypothetical protein